MSKTSSVSALIRDLKHPLQREVAALRKLILGISPEVREEIKWNSPSFLTSEHFATINLHAKDRLRLILHRGAKVKARGAKPKIDDPSGILQWLGPDRGLVTIVGAEDLSAKRAALKAILEQWIR